MSPKATEPDNNSFPVHELGSFRFDIETMSLSDGSGNSVRLRAQTGRVLKYLIENADKPVTKTELIEANWPAKFVTDDSLTQCISEIRRKIQDKDHRIIETFPKIGYQLNSNKKNPTEIDGGNLATQLNLIVRPIEDVSTAVLTLFTFCPPGPLARVNCSDSSQSASVILSLILMRQSFNMWQMMWHHRNKTRVKTNFMSKSQFLQHHLVFYSPIQMSTFSSSEIINLTI